MDSKGVLPITGTVRPKLRDWSLGTGANNRNIVLKGFGVRIGVFTPIMMNRVHQQNSSFTLLDIFGKSYLRPYPIHELYKISKRKFDKL